MERSIVDLRSDTVTRPTPAMREAMYRAPVGDDVWGEDPTVRCLEERAAALLGHEATLFVPSGTMGNLIAVLLHARPGEEVVLEERGHTMAYELGGISAFAGVLPRPVRAPRGHLTRELVEPEIRAGLGLQTRTALVLVENTHNMAGGTVLPLETGRALLDLAHGRGIPVHLDGARLFNAATALGVPVDRLAAPYDSVMVSLSKGLGAPAGSLLAGSRPFVAEARRARKRLGGGMRQIGILAAAGLVALDEMLPLLAADHENAQALAAGLRTIPGISVADEVETNIVIAEVSGPGPHGLDAFALVERLSVGGVLAMPLDARHLRLVTHHQVDRPGILRAVERFAEALDPV